MKYRVRAEMVGPGRVMALYDVEAESEVAALAKARELAEEDEVEGVEHVGYTVDGCDFVEWSDARVDGLVVLTKAERYLAILRDWNGGLITHAQATALIAIINPGITANELHVLLEEENA
jgi:hypothetical protein